MTPGKAFLIVALTVLSAGLMYASGQSDLVIDAVSSPLPRDIAATPHSTTYALPNPPGTEATLHTNGPLVTHPGGGFGGADASAVQGALFMLSYGFSNQGDANISDADDFTVTEDAGWAVDELCFYGYQTGSSTTSSFTQVDWTIWDGDPSPGGATAVCSGSATVAGGSLVTTWSGIYRTLDTDIATATTRPIMVNTVATGGCILAAATYWVEWESYGTLGSGPWAPPVTVLGSTGTGNGKQNQEGVWVDLVDVGPQDLPFEVKGTVNSISIECSDIFFFNAKCNMNGAAQAMVKMTGDWTGETVTFDLDGDDYISVVTSNGTNSIAKMTVPHAGMGSHTVTLEDPSGCYSPGTFNCQVDSRPDPEWDALWAESEALEATALEALPTETRIIGQPVLVWAGNYPNPFNPSTTIRYALSVDSPVSVRVYNMLGQEVATLVNGFQKAGEQSVVWHGANSFGQSVASGLYIYRLQAGNTVMTQKMLFTK